MGSNPQEEIPTFLSEYHLAEPITDILNAQNYEQLVKDVKDFDKRFMQKNYAIPIYYIDKINFIYRKDRFSFTNNPEAFIDIIDFGWKTQLI